MNDEKQLTIRKSIFKLLKRCQDFQQDQSHNRLLNIAAVFDTIEAMFMAADNKTFKNCVDTCENICLDYFVISQLEDTPPMLHDSMLDEMGIGDSIQMLEDFDEDTL